MTAVSEFCSYKPLELQWDMTLPQFLDEREFVETQTALKLAAQKDHEREMKQMRERK